MPLRVLSPWLYYLVIESLLSRRLDVGAACVSTILANFLGPGSAVLALGPRLGGDWNPCWLRGPPLFYLVYGVWASPCVVTVGCLDVSASLIRLLVDSSIPSLLAVLEGNSLFSNSTCLMGEDWTLYRCTFLPCSKGVCASSYSSASRIFSLSPSIWSTLSFKMSFCLS